MLQTVQVYSVHSEVKVKMDNLMKPDQNNGSINMIYVCGFITTFISS